MPSSKLTALLTLVVANLAAMPAATANLEPVTEPVPNPTKGYRDFSRLQRYSAYADVGSQIAVQSMRVQQNLPPKILEQLRAATFRYARSALTTDTFDFDAEVRSRVNLTSPNVTAVVFQTLVEAASAVEDDIAEAGTDQARMADQVKRVREYALFMRNLANSPSSSLSVQFFNDDCGAPTNFVTTRLQLGFDSLPDCYFVTSQTIDRTQIAELSDELNTTLTDMNASARSAADALNAIVIRRSTFTTKLRDLLAIVKTIPDSAISEIN